MCSAFPTRKEQKQHGAALILALVVFSIVALLASSLSMDFLVSVRRVENQLQGQQATAYLRGAEGLARSVILTDSTSSNNKDHISEGWLDLAQEYPMPNGVISGVICDLQGRFNLNNLQDTRNDSVPIPSFTPDQTVFLRLLQALPLETPLDLAQAEAITRAVIDWIDPGNIPRGLGGVEDYSDKEPAYRAANRAFTRVSELRWIEGITDPIYRALEPHVVALPEATPLNVNTAGWLLIRSLNEASNLEVMSEEEALRIIEERDGDIASGNPANFREGFQNIQEFESTLPFNFGSGDKPRYGVKSDYFLLQSTVLFLEQVSTRYAVLHREGNQVKTIARGRNGLGSCDNPYTKAVED